MEKKTTKATYEAVAQAADAIFANGGKRPSVRAVMAALGGGSPNVVASHLRRYWSEKPAVEARQLIVVDERIGSLIAEQIQTAAAAARQEADARAAEVAADLEEVSLAGQKVEAEAEELRSELETTRAQLQHRDGVIEQLRVDMAAAGERTTAEIKEAKEQAGQAVAVAREEAARERGLVERAQAELVAARVRLEAIPKLEAAVEALTANRELEQQKRAQAERALAAYEAEIRGLKTALDDLKAREVQVRQELETTRGEAQQARAAGLAAHGEAAGLRGQAEALRAEVAGLRAQLATGESKAPRRPAQA